MLFRVTKLKRGQLEFFENQLRGVRKCAADYSEAFQNNYLPIMAFLFFTDILLDFLQIFNDYVFSSPTNALQQA